MHIEGFNKHAVEGETRITRSISFVATAVIFLTTPVICIVLTIRWSMSNEYILRFITSRRCARQCILLRSICLRIPVQYILFIQYVARSWAQYILTPTIWLSTIPSTRIVILDVLLWTMRIELPSLNYYSLGRWLLLWKAGLGLNLTICWWSALQSILSYHHMRASNCRYVLRGQFGSGWNIYWDIEGKHFDILSIGIQVQYILANGGQNVLSTPILPAPP